MNLDLPASRILVHRPKMNNLRVKNLLWGGLFLLLFTACGDQTERVQRAVNKNLPKVDSSALKKAPAEPEGIRIKADSATQILTAYGKQNPETVVWIKTPMGNMKVKLYEDTPLHRANFVMLTKKKFYDEGEFYRVIKNFMIQGGDSDDRKMKLSRYLIPMEVKPAHFHKRGALAMAKHEYEKGSSSHDFFIVQGTRLSAAELNAIAKENNLALTPAQRKAYKTIGGVPSLDGHYTVFGEVTEGLDVIRKINSVKTSKEDWPLKEVRTKIEIIE